ncbi:MAG: dockerin type I repeat-containing protein, partial [Oscillospiraceae bacterium]
ETTTVTAIAIKLGLADSEVVSAKFTKKSNDKPGPSGPDYPTDPTKPMIGGKEMSWADIAAYLAKLPVGSEVTIELNGCTKVPVTVITVIDERDLKVTFVADSTKSWKTNGAEITSPAEADLSIIAINRLKPTALRGVSGVQFMMNSTNIPTDLAVSFNAEHAGKFANLYKYVDGKLTFVTCAKLGADGKALLPDVIDKGDYIAMLCEFSDLSGDISNDGVLNALDASALLKDVVGLEPGKNPLMADFNGDGNLNALDASAILKRIVGLAQ